MVVAPPLPHRCGSRLVRSVAGASALALAVAACGNGNGAGPTGPTATTAAARPLSVEPASGPIGTVFALAANGLAKGMTVQFEITFPGAERAFPGGALTVGDDGTATASYRATTANPPGAYSVRLAGAAGTLGTGSFTLTDGAPLTSAVPRSSTSAKTGGASTTRKSGATTTKAGGSTTSSTKAAGTTTTAPAVTTTKKPVTTSTSPSTVKVGP